MKKDDTVQLTREDSLYNNLKDDIRRGRFPPGIRLTEVDLAETHGMGRAVVRSVLRRLEAEDLVEIEPFRGARLPVLTTEEIVQRLAIREVLEGLSARLAAQKASPEAIASLHRVLADMEEAYRVTDVYRYSNSNGELHEVIGTAAENPKLKELLDTLKAHVVRYIFSSLLTAWRMRDSVEEHRRLVDAIADHDANRAEETARAHIRAVTNNIITVAKEDGQRLV